MKKALIICCYTIIVFLLGMFSEKTLVPYSEKTLVPYIHHLFHKPKISVVLSTYNRAKSLSFAVESILDQTFKDFEFIIIDDGSTDNSWEVIQSYAQQDSRIIPLKNKSNKGLVYSLNRGLDKARGEYIARMDDDDSSVPFRFERQVQAMDNNPDIIVLGSGLIGREETPLKLSSPPVLNVPEAVEINSYFSSALAHPTIMIRKDFIRKHNIHYNQKYLYAEDTGFYKDVLNAGGKISSINEGLLVLGYVTNVKRPDNYYDTQGESFKLVQKEKLKPFFDAPYEWLGAFTKNEVKCLILEKMVDRNRKLHILNQSLLEKKKQGLCEKEQMKKEGIHALHSQWEDYIYLNPDKKTFYRIDVPEETGKIIKEDKQTVTVKWKNWGTEIFKKEKNGKEWRFKEEVK